MTSLLAVTLACFTVLALCVYIGGAVSRYDQPDLAVPEPALVCRGRLPSGPLPAAYRFHWRRLDADQWTHVAGLYAGPWTAVPVMGQVRELVAA